MKHRLWVGLLLSNLFCSIGWSQESTTDTQPPSLLEQIRSHDHGLGIWWTGHNGWLLKYDDLLIGTDLVVGDPGREHPAPISASELAAELDVSIVTHAHGDHFNGPTSQVLARQSDCLFVLPRSCFDRAAKLGIPELRIVEATPRSTLEVKGIKIDAIRAIHGNRQGAVYWEANLDDCGYVIHIGGRTVMQPGDSVLLEDHLFREHVDVLFLSATEHNMQIHNSVTLINALSPDFILPQHRNTYPVTAENRFWTYAYTYEVEKRLSQELRERYRVLAMGGKLQVATE